MKLQGKEEYINKPNNEKIDHTSVTVKELRAKTNLTQEQFAEKYNIPVTTLRKWEQGKTKCPSHMIELLHIKIISNTTEYTHYSIDTFIHAYMAHKEEITVQTGEDVTLAFLSWCKKNNTVLNEVQRVLNVGERVKNMLQNEEVIKELKEMAGE